MIRGITVVSVQQPYHKSCTLTHKGGRHVSTTCCGIIMINLSKDNWIEPKPISLYFPVIWNCDQGIINPNILSRWKLS